MHSVYVLVWYLVAAPYFIAGDNMFVQSHFQQSSFWRCCIDEVTNARQNYYGVGVIL